MSGTSNDLSQLAYLHGVEQKLKDLDTRLSNAQPKKKDGWDKFQSLSSFLSAIIVLLASLFITNRVEQALKERQLQLANVKEMEQILEKITDVRASPDTVRSASLTLAAYGRYAVPPLIQVMRNNPPEHLAAAMDGLRAVGATEPKVVCQQLTAIINNRTQLYHVEVHQNAVQLLGDINCQGSTRALEMYIDRLGQTKPTNAPFSKVPGSQTLSENDIESVRTQAEGALKALRAQAADEPY